MCEVCIRQEGKIGDALRPFLRMGTSVTWEETEAGGEQIILRRGDRPSDILVLTADGDHEPTYFHWGKEPSEAKSAELSDADLVAEIVEKLHQIPISQMQGMSGYHVDRLRSIAAKLKRDQDD